jgi:hypothetical protein
MAGLTIVDYAPSHVAKPIFNDLREMTQMIVNKQLYEAASR